MVSLLTPVGVQQKTVVAANFLKRKLAEYEALKREIEELSAEMGLDQGDERQAFDARNERT